MSEPVENDGLKLGTKVQDRDPRHPNRTGAIVDLTPWKVVVAWNTGRKTEFARETCLQRFRVVEARKGRRP